MLTNALFSLPFHYWISPFSSQYYYIFLIFLLSLLLTPSCLFFHGFMRWWGFILMLWDISFLFLSPSLLLTSLKESFKPTNKKNIYFGRAGKGGGQGNYLGGKGQCGVMGGGEEGAYQKQRHICKLPFSTFRSLQAVFPVWMCVSACVCARRSCVCVCEHVCRYGCVCASMFSGEGSWGGGFCNVFCRKRTQMTFNWQCFGEIAGFCLLIATSQGWSWNPSLY